MKPNGNQLAKDEDTPAFAEDFPSLCHYSKRSALLWKVERVSGNLESKKGDYLRYIHSPPLPLRQVPLTYPRNRHKSFYESATAFTGIVWSLSRTKRDKASAKRLTPTASQPSQW